MIAAPLASNALFSGVAPAALLRALPVFRMVTLATHDVLYAGGEPEARLFLIVSGSVAIVQRTAGAETLVAVLGPGEFTGERALLDPDVRSRWSAVCREPTTVAIAGGAAFYAAVGTLPGIGVNVAQALHRRVRAAAHAIDELIAGR